MTFSYIFCFDCPSQSLTLLSLSLCLHLCLSLSVLIVHLLYIHVTNKCSTNPQEEEISRQRNIHLWHGYYCVMRSWSRKTLKLSSFIMKREWESLNWQKIRWEKATRIVWEKPQALHWANKKNTRGSRPHSPKAQFIKVQICLKWKTLNREGHWRCFLLKYWINNPHLHPPAS